MQIDHTEYPKRIKKNSDSSLRFIIRDCQAAITANPDGHKAGYYADEINYCAMELKGRE